MEFVLFEIKDAIGIITINRPDVYNAINRGAALEIQNYIKECGTNEEVRAVLLQSNGKAFSTGQDLKDIEDLGDNIIQKIVNELYNPIIRLLTDLEKPIVCAIQGMAVGAGANIALACDLVLADENSYLCQIFTSIGLIPDSGGTYILPRLIGLQKAKAAMMLAEKISGTEAEKMGMIYKAVPDGTVHEAAYKIAQKLATRPTRALGLTKKALHRGLYSDLTTQLDIEEQYQSLAGNSADFIEGVMAFREKRKPNFIGK